jgi:Zn-dependent M16 (insulinase) family peptidase
VARTIDVFSGVGDFIKTAELTNEDIKEAILQVCSEIDKPDPPGPAAGKAFSRMIVGLTDESRKTFKQNLLKVTKEHLVRITSEHCFGDPARSGVAVIAGQPQLEAANKKMGERPLSIKKI